jgi:hypothetical protein
MKFNSILLYIMCFLSLASKHLMSISTSSKNIKNEKDIKNDGDSVRNHLTRELPKSKCNKPGYQIDLLDQMKNKNES